MDNCVFPEEDLIFVLRHFNGIDFLSLGYMTFTPRFFGVLFGDLDFGELGLNGCKINASYAEEYVIAFPCRVSAGPAPPKKMKNLVIERMSTSSPMADCTDYMCRMLSAGKFCQLRELSIQLSYPRVTHIIQIQIGCPLLEQLHINDSSNSVAALDWFPTGWQSLHSIMARHVNASPACIADMAECSKKMKRLLVVNDKPSFRVLVDATVRAELTLRYPQILKLISFD